MKTEDIQRTRKLIEDLKDLLPHHVCDVDPEERKLFVSVLRSNYGRIGSIVMEFEGSPPLLPIYIYFFSPGDSSSAELCINGARTTHANQNRPDAIELIIDYLTESGYVRQSDLITHANYPKL